MPATNPFSIQTGVVNHGGKRTTYRSIQPGLPMLLVPLAGMIFQKIIYNHLPQPKNKSKKRFFFLAHCQANKARRNTNTIDDIFFLLLLSCQINNNNSNSNNNSKKNRFFTLDSQKKKFRKTSNVFDAKKV